MREPRRQLDLEEKALRSDFGRDLGAQHLQRDLPIVTEILREEHDRHAAFAELARNGVSSGECRGEARLECVHGGEDAAQMAPP